MIRLQAIDLAKLMIYYWIADDREYEFELMNVGCAWENGLSN